MKPGIMNHDGAICLMADPRDDGVCGHLCASQSAASMQLNAALQTEMTIQKQSITTLTEERDAMGTQV